MNKENIELVLRAFIQSNQVNSSCNGDKLSGAIWTYFDSFTYSTKAETFLNYEIKKIDSFGGYEDFGEEMGIVLSIKNNDTQEEVFVKFDGEYNSWDVNFWHPFEVVQQRPVEVMQWVKVD